MADLDDVLGWSGATGPNDDYRRACELLDRVPNGGGGTMPLGVGTRLVWDMPTGTADVWRHGPDTIVISRPWVDDEDVASFLARTASYEAV